MVSASLQSIPKAFQFHTSPDGFFNAFEPTLHSG